MCITPQHAQWTVHFKTNPLLSAVLLIICLIPLGSARCPPGQFLHFNPETNVGVCCVTVPLPIGYRFISCKVNGTLDSIEKCPEGLHQPDETRTESEATCSKEFECNPEEHFKISSCDISGQNCVSTCVCNYERGYCGKFSYDCRKFPKDCPSELVQRDCSCKRDPPPVTSTSPGNASNKPGQTIITTPSTTSANGGSKPTQENDKTKDDGGVDINNGTANTNGTGIVPDQAQSTVLNVAVIAIVIVFAAGVIAVVILVYIFHRRLKNWLSKYRNFCCQNRPTNPEQDFVVIIDSDKSNQDEPCEQGKEEAQPFLSEVRSENGYDDQKNLTGGQSEDSSIQAGVTHIQSLLVDNGGSDGCYGAQNNPAGDENDSSIQAGGTNMQSLVVDTDGSKGLCGDQKNPAGDHDEGGRSKQDGVTRIQFLVADVDGSKGLCGDQKNPAGDHNEGGRSKQDGVTRIQSLVADVAKTKDCSNEGLFCKCCGLPSSRCRKKKKDIPVGKVDGTRQTPQFLEMPSTGYVGSEMSVNGFLSFTSSINHDLELHDSTNTVDEETTVLKPVNSPEATDSDNQVLSIMQQRNEVEQSRFEESQQTDFNDESHVPTGMPAREGRYRTDSHFGQTNRDEEDLKIENEEDVEEE